MKEYRVYIRPITEADTADIIRWRNSEEVKKYFIQQADFTPESHKYWLDNYVNTGKAEQFIIVTKDTETSIGSVYLKDIDLVHRKAEYGIFIGEEAYMSKGLGSEAAKLILDHAFNDLKLHRIYLRAYADNERAINSYKKAGFQLEGILKDDVYVRDEYRDMAWMAMINPNDIKE